MSSAVGAGLSPQATPADSRRSGVVISRIASISEGTRSSSPVVRSRKCLTQTEELNMRIFLTGASGYIGSAVAERLRAAGHQLTGLARSDASAARLRSAGIDAVRGDFSDPSSVAAGARSADGVISMATTYDAAIDGP